MALKRSFTSDPSRAALTIGGTRGNLITAELVTQLRRTLADLREESQLKLMTIEGDGADFSFGASVPEHAPGEIDRVLPEFHALIVEMMRLPIPTAAIVRGRCFGGGFEIALACDFIFASDSSTFALPEIALGVFAPAASVLIPRRLGLAAATSAVVTGQSRTARDWQALGLIELVAPDVTLDAVVDAWFGRTLGSKSATALGHAVMAIRGRAADDVARELAVVEQLYLNDLMRTVDAREGIQAFMEKRTPKWEGQ